MNLESLRGSEIFSEMDPGQFSRFENIATLHSYKAGEMIFSLGTYADQLYLINEGKVELLFPLQIFGTLRDICMEVKNPGDTIAWSALVPPYKLTLSARSAVDTTLVGFSSNDLRLLFDQEPRIGFIFMRNLTQVVGQRLQRIEAMFAREIQRMVRDKYRVTQR